MLKRVEQTMIKPIKTLSRLAIAASVFGVVISASGGQVLAQESANSFNTGVPTLIVTNKPTRSVGNPMAASTLSGRQVGDIPVATLDANTPPASPLRTAAIQPQIDPSVYMAPVRVRDIQASQILGEEYYSPFNTLASQKVQTIRSEMATLQSDVVTVAGQLQTLETVGQELAANYYAAVATINTQLQAGTTPGNPRLKNRLTLADDALDTLGGNVADLNKLAVRSADLASTTEFYQQQIRAAYNLSGSVEEDHVELAKLEDQLSSVAIAIERLLNGINDDITRATAYLASERDNMRTLTLAVAEGDLYGKSLSHRPFSMAGDTDIMSEMGKMGLLRPSAAAAVADNTVAEGNVKQARPSSPRPLIKIRFDRPDVDYSQALYMTLDEALKEYPQSQFELVAVSPGAGNPAKLAIEGTQARRNAEKVLRDMVQMGVDTDRVKLANATQDNIQYNEVHLFIR